MLYRLVNIDYQRGRDPMRRVPGGNGDMYSLGQVDELATQHLEKKKSATFLARPKIWFKCLNSGSALILQGSNCKMSDHFQPI